MSLFETLYKYTSTNREGFLVSVLFASAASQILFENLLLPQYNRNIFSEMLFHGCILIFFCVCATISSSLPLLKEIWVVFKSFLLLMIGSWISWSSYLCLWARDRDSWMGNGWSKVILHFISFFLFYTIHGVRCITSSTIHLICRYISLSSHPDQNIEHFQHP